MAIKLVCSRHASLSASNDLRTSMAFLSINLRYKYNQLSDDVTQDYTTPNYEKNVFFSRLKRQKPLIRMEFKQFKTLIVKKMLKTKELLPILRKTFPTLRYDSRKGQNGRVGVIGGSFEFTGAPFYTAIASLKAGGDLAHIFCSKSASIAIKAYSPEVIVHPVFVSQNEVKLTEEELIQAHEDWLKKILSWKNAINSWVIGPGLGRDDYMSSFFPKLIKSLPSGCLTVLDADGIYFLSKYPELLGELKRFKTILTPNARELSLLKQIIDLDIEDLYEKYRSEEEIQEIPSSEKFKDFSICVKGREDLILTNKRSFIVRTIGGNKRCGGLGDVLTGVISVTGSWDEEYGMVLGSKIMRTATRAAFQKEGRGMTAPTVISELPRVVMNLEKPSL